MCEEYSDAKIVLQEGDEKKKHHEQKRFRKKERKKYCEVMLWVCVRVRRGKRT